MEVISGKIIQHDERGLLIAANYSNIERASLRQYNEVQIGLPDGRTITPDQRRKAYALMGEIAAWSGYTPEEIKLTAKRQYIEQHMQALHKQLFSLSDCDMTEARGFISYLVEFVLEFDVPVRVPLSTLCDDTQHYVYACAMRRKCAVCGLEHADLHHVDKVGMGSDRTKVDHVGRRAITLCREHHSEAEQIGDVAFFAKYHLEPIILDETLVKKLKLRGKKRE